MVLYLVGFGFSCAVAYGLGRLTKGILIGIAVFLFGAIAGNLAGLVFDPYVLGPIDPDSFTPEQYRIKAFGLMCLATLGSVMGLWSGRKMRRGSAGDKDKHQNGDKGDTRAEPRLTPTEALSGRSRLSPVAHVPEIAKDQKDTPFMTGEIPQGPEHGPTDQANVLRNEIWRTHYDYNDAVRRVFDELSGKSQRLGVRLAELLVQSPKGANLANLVAQVLEEGERHQGYFEREEAEMTHKSLKKISEDAAAEFRRVIGIMGEDVDLDGIAKKIRGQFAAQETSLAGRGISVH